MLSHHNPAAPHLITFLCPHTLAAATVDANADTLHPIARKHFGDCTAAFITAVTASFAELREEPWNPKVIPGSTIALPAWMLFVTTDTGKPCILHTETPVFLSPVLPFTIAGKPIADAPPIPPEEMEHWQAAATREARRLSESWLPESQAT
jgi:hypothetical protein